MNQNEVINRRAARATTPEPLSVPQCSYSSRSETKIKITRHVPPGNGGHRFIPPDEYIPGVDDPELDQFQGHGTQSTQSTQVSSGSALEGDGTVEPEAHYAESIYPTESTEFHPEPTAPTEFHSSGEVGKRVAALLASLQRTDGKYPRWRVPFELARVLKGFPAESPVEFEGLVTAFFRARGWDEFEGWVAFVNYWGLIRRPAGHDAWDVAVATAKARPLAITPDPGPRLSVLASVAAYLASSCPAKKSFIFSVPRVVRSFGWPKATASRAINALVALGVIEWADPTWSFTEGRAREARFIGTIHNNKVS